MTTSSHPKALNASNYLIALLFTLFGPLLYCNAQHTATHTWNTQSYSTLIQINDWNETTGQTGAMTYQRTLNQEYRNQPSYYPPFEGTANRFLRGNFVYTETLKLANGRMTTKTITTSLYYARDASGNLQELDGTWVQDLDGQVTSKTLSAQEVSAYWVEPSFHVANISTTHKADGKATKNETMGSITWAVYVPPRDWSMIGPGGSIQVHHNGSQTEGTPSKLLPPGTVRGYDNIPYQSSFTSTGSRTSHKTYTSSGRHFIGVDLSFTASPAP